MSWNGPRLLQSYNKDETTYLILLDEDIACASPWSSSEKMLGSEASSRNSISSLRGGEPTRGNWVAWPALHSQKERGRDTSSTSRARPPCPWGEVYHLLHARVWAWITWVMSAEHLAQCGTQRPRQTAAVLLATRPRRKSNN